MEDLKPCPFCGKKPHVAPVCSGVHLKVTSWAVSCENVESRCVVMQERDTEEQAITAWNTRTPEAVNKALLDALRKRSVRHDESCNCVVNDDAREICDCGVDEARAAIKQAESQTLKEKE